MSRRRPLALLLLALTLTSCKSLVPGGARAGEADEMTRLKESIRELQRQARMNEVEIARLRRQVAELSARLEGGRGEPAAAGPFSPVDSAPAAPAEPPAAVAPRPAVGELEQEDLEIPPPPAPAAAPTPSAAPGAVDGAGQALYDRGYTLYHQGSYVDAESAFQSFLQQFPASDLADNAQFWIGEARLRRGDTAGALAAFRETVTRFPRGNKVADALFRSGDCLEKLGDLDGAREAWRQTIDRFPTSAAAALSEERLAAVP